jgi:aryl-alcohol dehydrogenase-like predicted oxidoreductase
MSKKETPESMHRRDFVKLSAAAVGGSALLPRSMTGESLSTARVIRRNQQPTMTYRRLGRTDFLSSRLVFGCGAALRTGKSTRLLDRAFEAGINHYDVGSDVYYKGSERQLAPFMKEHRDDIWVASKAILAPARIEYDAEITRDHAVEAARFWTRLLNASLRDLDTDYVDAYYLMGVEHPTLIRSEEIYQAFLDAKSAGKVGYFGLSTHKNTSAVLEAAIETGWYDAAMIGITPMGWYDWITKEIEEGAPTLLELQPLLTRAREAGIGLIGMKTARYLAPMGSSGKGDPTAFDHVYDDNFKASSLSPFQRSIAYVLEHGLDVVNADMQNFSHFEENVVAAATSQDYFG